ncbi:Crp/Fnr family transcriptional regulator [Parasphingorhabdus sp.]|uniref:Crp/Fnr family transcriptional regulator n=1 Tax=Parasphingorhabdus sp. TaxID=2709688 RepID=UPI002F920376
MKHSVASHRQLSFDEESIFHPSTALSQKLKAYIHNEGVASTRCRGEYLFHQGDHVGNIYYIDEGCVAILNHCKNDHRQIFDFLFSNSIILDAGGITWKANHSAQCMSEVNMHILSSESFRRILMAEPQLYSAVAEIMSNSVARAYRGLGNIMCRQGPARVAYILLSVHSAKNQDLMDFPKTTPSDNRIKIRQVDLAAAIGVTPVYFNQILKKMKADGLINLIKGEIEICDIKSIKETALMH